MAVNQTNIIRPVPPLEGEVIPKNKYTIKGRLKKPTGKKSTIITEAKWRDVLAYLADGTSVANAVEITKIPKYAVEAHLRADPAAKAQWEDAKTASLWKQWDQDTLEDIMVSISMGKTVKSSVAEYATFDSPDYVLARFYKLLLRDPIVKEMYEEARQIQAEKMAIDDLIEISDDASGDETADGRPNSAAVNRSRLRVQSRQWITSRMNFKRFGDHKHVEIDANIVVDHASRLEEARRRKEELNSSKEKNA